MSKLHYIIGEKSQWDAFFSDFFRKNYCSNTHDLSKKRPFSKKIPCSHAHILLEKRPFSQKHSALMSFFLIFYGKSPTVIPIFGQKINSVNYIMGQQSQ